MTIPSNVLIRVHQCAFYAYNISVSRVLGTSVSPLVYIHSLSSYYLVKVSKIPDKQDPDFEKKVLSLAQKLQRKSMVYENVLLL